MPRSKAGPSRDSASRDKSIGSHQSESEQAETAAESARAEALLRTTSKAKGKQRAPAQIKKAIRKSTDSLFKIQRPTTGSSDSAARRRVNKKAKAVCEFVRAKYTKGDFTNEYTGAVLFRGKPSYSKGNNERFKEKVDAVLLEENVRFNMELKCFTAKVQTVEVAIAVREAMKAVSEADEATLTENGPTDKDIDEVFNFDEVKTFDLHIIESLLHEGTEVMGIAGDTFPFKTRLKDAGFSYARDKRMWVAPVDTDTTYLEEIFLTNGFNITSHVGAEDHEDDASEHSGDAE